MTTLKTIENEFIRRERPDATIPFLRVQFGVPETVTVTVGGKTWKETAFHLMACGETEAAALRMLRQGRTAPPPEDESLDGKVTALVDAVTPMDKQEAADALARFLSAHYQPKAQAA